MVTLIGPDAPDPTIALMLVGESTVNDVAGVPPKLTAVAPVRFVPVITTVTPAVALDGVKELMDGVEGTVNINPVNEIVPAGVVMLTFPDVPAPTIAVMLVGESTVKDVAGVPPKHTAVAPVRFVPVITTVSPAVAVDGEKELNVGAGR